MDWRGIRINQVLLLKGVIQGLVGLVVVGSAVMVGQSLGALHTISHCPEVS